MAYFMYNSNTGALVEVSEELIYGGCPPSGMAISYIDVSMTDLENGYVWNAEDRDFVPKVV